MDGIDILLTIKEIQCIFYKTKYQLTIFFFYFLSKTMTLINSAINGLYKNTFVSNIKQC